MIDLRRTCQALLNGPCQPTDLAVAETRLNQALTTAGAVWGGQTPVPGEPWRCESINGPTPDDANRAFMLEALAPLGLLEGIWLARVALPASGHLPLQNRLLGIYTSCIGLDNPALAPPIRYRAALTQAGKFLPAVNSPDFFQIAAFGDTVLQFVLHHLTFFHRPTRYFPELVGYTLAHLSRETLEPDDPELAVIRRQQLNEIQKELSGAALKHDRLLAGAMLYIEAYARAHRDLGVLIRQPALTAEARMAAILSAKLSHAVGYHARVRLGERSLDAWLVENQDQPEVVLHALRQSPHVNAACPVASRLLKAMTFSGPMFGVFSPEEQAAAQAWIADPEGRPRSALPMTSHYQPCTPAPIPSATLPQHGASHPMTLRELYTALLASESPADVPNAARRRVHRTLQRTRWRLWLAGKQPPFAYSPAALAEFVTEEHRAELARYRPLSGPPKVDKAFCLWALLQLTPTLLVDGAWLAGIPGAAESLDTADRNLLRIFLDELGDSRPDWNHPNVYRRLLASQGIQLPDFASKAFAQYPAFRDAAFELPVYLLAMGLFTDDWRPEILGLNLAIEMSGLGASYLRAIDILRHHGLDPAIVQLHLSIDNPASGHAARARDAIALHLDTIRRLDGSAAVGTAWRRIWLGYQSLGVATLGLTTCLLFRYALHRLGWSVKPPNASAA